MIQPNNALWEEVDLPMLRRIVALYDSRGAFKVEELPGNFEIELSPKDFAYSTKRLADNGYMESQNRAGGFPHLVQNVTDKARQAVSGTQAPSAEAPRLAELGPRLVEILAQAHAALESEPNHPDAPRWRGLLNAAVEIGIDFRAKTDR